MSLAKSSDGSYSLDITYSSSVTHIGIGPLARRARRRTRGARRPQLACVVAPGVLDMLVPLSPLEAERAIPRPPAHRTPGRRPICPLHWSAPAGKSFLARGLCSTWASPRHRRSLSQYNYWQYVCISRTAVGTCRVTSTEITRRILCHRRSSKQTHRRSLCCSAGWGPGLVSLVGKNTREFLDQGNPPWFMAATTVSRYKVGPRPHSVRT